MKTEHSGNGSPAAEPLLSVRGLTKYFPLRKSLLPGQRSWVKAVDGVSFDVFRG